MPSRTEKGTISALISLALCSRSRFAKLVEVPQENAQLEIRPDFCVASGYLFPIVIQKKVHRIGRIHIVQNDVRIIHREPAETQSISPVRHVVCVLQRCGRRRASATKGLNNRVILNPYRGHFAVDVRRRQNLLQIQNQIVSFGLHATRDEGVR